MPDDKLVVERLTQVDAAREHADAALRDGHERRLAPGGVRAGTGSEHQCRMVEASPGGVVPDPRVSPHQELRKPVILDGDGQANLRTAKKHEP